MKTLIVVCLLAGAAMAHPATAPPIGSHAVLKACDIAAPLITEPLLVHDASRVAVSRTGSTTSPRDAGLPWQPDEAVPERGASRSWDSLVCDLLYETVAKSARQPFFIIDHRDAG